ncbi:MAG: UDP-N-acetylmuramoyl-tripeptide--D-alanyl-D-alanine ligase [Candidatus Omnitrophota bacterium]
MEPITLKEALAWTSGTLRQGKEECIIKSFSTDTRNIRPGDFFIPISGSIFDGHKFIFDAARKGARGSFYSTGYFSPAKVPPPHLNPPPRGGRCGGGDFILIEVKDTRQALLAIAKNYRRKFRIPVICLTGSCGKTTTKELITHILKDSYKVLANPGNFNNEIGLPLSLLSITKRHDVAVLELGMNHPGEIAALSEAAQPQYGMITNIGSAHLGFFRSREEIAHAKAELLAYLASVKDATAFLPADDTFFPFLSSFPVARKITFGFKTTADYFLREVKGGATPPKFDSKGASFILHRKKGEPLSIKVPLFSSCNLKNVLAAIALTLEFGVKEDVLVKRLKSFKSLPHRFELKKKAGVYFVDDTYNANPTSFRLALSDFYRLAGENKKIVVAGSMAELGRFSTISHLSLGKFLARLRPDFLLLIGPEKRAVCAGAMQAGFPYRRLRFARDNQTAAGIIRKHLSPGTFVFLKGSRFLKMEDILTFLNVI